MDELEEFCAGLERKDIVELWLIVNCIYPLQHNLDRAIPLFEGENPLPSFPKDWTDAWGKHDMGQCAWIWCRELLRKPKSGEPPAVADVHALWVSIRQEMHLLCCTKDKKYSALRKKIAALSGKSQLTVTAAIASVVAAHVGILTASLATPLCAIMLLAVLGVGKEVFCQRISVPIALNIDHSRDWEIFPGGPGWELGLTLGDAKKLRPRRRKKAARKSSVKNTDI
jgi:hypothetical protein